MLHIINKIRHNINMKKKKDYIVLMSVFLLCLFSNSINMFISMINPNLDNKNIKDNYDKHIYEEYTKLKKMNDINIDEELNLIISRIKYRNVYSFKEEITIYKGYNDNIEVGDVILTNDGLIGTIIKTYKNYSIGKLITNKNSNISVSVNDSVGILNYKDNELIINSVNNYSNINKGDKVYTSGLGNINKGIYVGKVKEIVLSNTKIEQIIKLEPRKDLENINYVYIMKVSK